MQSRITNRGSNPAPDRSVAFRWYVHPDGERVIYQFDEFAPVDERGIGEQRLVGPYTADVRLDGVAVSGGKVSYLSSSPSTCASSATASSPATPPPGAICPETVAAPEPCRCRPGQGNAFFRVCAFRSATPRTPHCLFSPAVRGTPADYRRSGRRSAFPAARLRPAAASPPGEAASSVTFQWRIDPRGEWVVFVGDVESAGAQAVY